ncbi:MAG: hypothetical protein JSC189_001342 [Candidatus Tokpelaia sp. JSC189]|nr:MAG: hypothetical protein JSC189_001342 [Candidatus Tokpelaia sp. JSC189]
MVEVNKNISVSGTDNVVFQALGNASSSTSVEATLNISIISGYSASPAFINANEPAGFAQNHGPF